ncbi:MAG: DUF2490 domain-containing protein [Cyclobacteriaceae bacterium]
MYLFSKTKLVLVSLVLFFLTCSFGVSAQNSSSNLEIPENAPPTSRTNLRATTESWNGLYLKFRLTDRFFYYQENHYRRRSSIDNRTDFVGRMSQLYNRAGLTYLVNPNFEITLGPTLVWNFTPTPGDLNFEKTTLEPRIWHQWLLNHSMGRVKILHQFRFEHRWKRDNRVGEDYQYTDRWRYKFFAYIPINKPRMEDKTFFISPSNEFFFEAGKHTLDIFEENRIYTAIGYTYGNFQFFGGHMWTYGPSNFATYRNRHIIRLNVFYNLDFRKDILKPKLTD